MQGETAAGNNVRQSAVLLQKLIKVQIIVAYDKLNVYIRQLCLHIGGVLLVQLGRPQVYLNGLGILLLLQRFGAFSGAAAQQGYTQRHGSKQGKTLVQSFFLHTILLLPTRDGLPFDEASV